MSTEALARVLCSADGLDPDARERGAGPLWEHYQTQAAHILADPAPLLAALADAGVLTEIAVAEAWDEGYDAGHQAARAVNPEWPEQPTNPYRAGRAGGAVKTEIKFLDSKKLAGAFDASFYTIVGAGGDPSEWVEGYAKELVAVDLPAPTKWYQSTGAEVNIFAGVTEGPDAFPEDLTFLMFPLKGLDIAKLAIFKIRMADRWFDDIVSNMRG